MERSLYHIYKTEAIAKLGTSAYEGEIVTPSMTFEKMKLFLRDSTSTHSPKETSKGINPKLRLRPPLVPKLAPFEQVQTSVWFVHPWWL